MSSVGFIVTLRAQWLGQYLREIRAERGLTLKLVSEHLNRESDVLARYERAEWPIPRADVASLLDLYGVHDSATREQVLRLAENVWRTNRWRQEPGDTSEAAFIDLPWLAQRAQRLCVYHPNLVPQPVRTPLYHELVARRMYPTHWLPFLMEQHRELQGALVATTTVIKAVVDESALYQTAWATEILQAQLVHLLELQQGGRVEIRVLPRDVASYPRLGEGPWWLFEMPSPYPPVGYLDDLAGHHFVELPYVERFADAYQQLSEAALDPFASTGLIEKRVAELS